MDNHSKGAFAKAFQKTLIRTKAKVLQNLGRADKTTDERFEDHVANFTKQQAVAVRLCKEVKHYVQCVKAMTAASRSLYAVIQECCEPEWIDLHTVDSAMRSLDMLYSNYEAELFERVCSDLQTYVELFNPMKEKISKRRRKLLDYDNAKHGYEAALSAKKRDEVRVAKANESLQEAEATYNNLNTELHRELPKFYDYRIDFIASNLNRLYSTESTFHLETGKVSAQLHELMESVPKSEQRPACTAVESPMDHTGLDLSAIDSSEHSINERNGTRPLAADPHKDEVTYEVENGAAADAAGGGKVAVEVSGDSQATNIVNANITSKPEQRDKLHESDTILLAESTVDGVEYDIPPPAKEVPTMEEKGGESQSGCVSPGQQVLATHKYVAQDDDELSFEAGEIIDVVEFDDPDEQDEGWLMGVSRTSGRRGVFPQNFTRKVVGRRTSDT